ncbi:MAG: hypothetical protein MRY57_04055 [Candidatus Pacebacteria bacterium]|nr:hypothetical protein [Candidatus Paceibacterota bacterium]
MNIKKYLPSPKVRIGILIFAGLALVYLGYFLVQKYYAPNEEQAFIDVAFVNETEDTRSDLYLDSDNDGAYDWEEALWPELDPNNPDSDGDGVSDGRYIKAKRAEARRAELGDDFVESNLTETQKLGRGALSALIALQQSGEEITPETEAQITENITTYINELTLGEKIYTRDQFNLVENTQENSYTYRDEMTALFRQYPVATSDIEVLVQATQESVEYQGRLRSIAKKYNDYLGALTTLDVPFIIAGRHTELVNNISQIAGSTNNLLQEESDELVALATIVQLETIMNETAEAIIKINTYFEIIEDESVFE